MTPPSFAASRLVNPLGVTPVITEAQLWAGLQRKVRFPTEFIPAITSCEVITDTRQQGASLHLFSSRTRRHLTAQRALGRQRRRLPRGRCRARESRIVRAHHCKRLAPIR